MPPVPVDIKTVQSQAATESNPASSKSIPSIEDIAQEAWKVLADDSAAEFARRAEWKARLNNETQEESPVDLHNLHRHIDKFVTVYKHAETLDTPENLLDLFKEKFTSSDEDATFEALDALVTHVRYVVEVVRSRAAPRRFRDLLKVYERICISLLGHEHQEAREEAVRLLNMIYDGLDWQFTKPHTPIVKCAGDDFAINSIVRLPTQATATASGSPVLMLSAPSFDLDIQSDNIITFHRPEEVISVAEHFGEGSHRLIYKFPEFPRTGDLLPLQHADGELAQGRFIVQPRGLREEHLHEVVVDMTGKQQAVAAQALAGEATSQPVQSVGTFHNVAEMLPDCAKRHISSVYLMGALERDNGVSNNDSLGGPTPLDCERPGASPVAVTCRRTPNRMLGGTPGFKKVVQVAKSNNVRILTQCSCNISATRYHRRYKDLLVKTLDEKGELVPHRGSDAKANEWEDQVLLNYRKLEAWEVMVDDILALSEIGVGGLYLQQAQSWPPILSADEDELGRLDIDGTPCYGIEEAFYGDVVRRNEELGFWTTHASTSYPNPFLIKIARAVWKKDPQFLLLGKTYWGRTHTLVLSGVTPRDIGLASAMAQARGRKVDKDGRVSLISAPPSPVQPLYLWLLDQCQLPEGSLPLQARSICQETLPYPSHLFGRAAWTAVDLMYLLPGIPMTFIREDEGAVFRMDLSNIYSRADNEEWRQLEREERIRQQMQREKRRMEQRRKWAAQSVHQPKKWSLAGALIKALPGSSTNLFDMGQTDEDGTSSPGLRLSRTSSMENTDSTTQAWQPWKPPLQPNLANSQSAASLTSVGSAESLRKILEQALNDDSHDTRESLGLTSSMQRVQSWSVFGAAAPNEPSLDQRRLTSGDSALGEMTKVLSASRLDVLNHKALADLEAKARQDLGPQFGFDLSKISLHYNHRRDLRKQMRILREGLTGVVEARRPNSSDAHSHVFGFVRWLPEAEDHPTSIPGAKEVCLIASNFDTDHASFVLHLEQLKFLLVAEDDDYMFNNSTRLNSSSSINSLKCQPGGSSSSEISGKGKRQLPRKESFSFSTSQITGFWECTDLLHEGFDDEIINDAISSYELINNKLPVTLRGHASMCLHMKWVTATPEEAELRLLASAFGRIQRALKSTEFEPSSGGPTFNPSDQEMMMQLRNNYVFTRFERALCSAAENPSQAQEALYGAFRPLRKVLPEQNFDHFVGLIRKTFFFAVRYCQETYERALSDEDAVDLLRSIAGGKVERPFGSRDDAMEMDISAFISNGPDIYGAGQYLVGKSDRPLPPTILDKLHGSVVDADSSVYRLCQEMVKSNTLETIVFIAPELGRWSTVGGLGVMVDELTRGLAQLGADVMVISPYYEKNRKGQSGYLAKDNIQWTRNLHIRVGGVTIEAGVHEGRVNGVKLMFIHHSEIFPSPYPSGNAWHQVRMLSFIAKASLEALCQKKLIPSLVVTNDWFAGFVPAYARTGHFGRPSVFANTKFLHLVHNLDQNYEGRQYPAPHEGDLYGLHNLPVDLLVDPYWGDKIVINPSRVALLASDGWATVSNSYKKDLLGGSPLSPLLHRCRHPFSTSNGVPIVLRRSTLMLLDHNSKYKAKKELQRKYFHMTEGDNNIPLLSFVGRVTEQKGVHLILNAAEQLIRETGGRIQIICGGPSSEGDPYGSYCAGRMRWLAYTFPHCFWADPGAFFMDGPIVNLGSDFGLMPSLFEPGGIVQHEMFSAGTPVIAFKTGGLKDSVHEYNPKTGEGNGFTFEAHTHDDLIFAIRRALTIYVDAKQYQRLRFNASQSVIDVADVAVAWLREFNRLCRCVNDPVLTVLRLSGRGISPTSTVQLVGSFTKWDTYSSVRCNYSPDTDEFSAVLRLYPGTYTYKFIVNGKWMCAPDYPKINDGHGQHNNVVTVSYGFE